MSATVSIAFLALLLAGGAAAQQPSAGNLPAFDTTWSALAPSFTPVTARRVYRRLRVPPKSEFETEEAYRSRLEDAFVPGTHGIPVVGFRLMYDADSGAFSVIYETAWARGIDVGADGLSDGGMIVSARSSKLLRTESRTNAFGARIQVQVWLDTLFGVMPIDDSGEPGLVIVPKWRISPDRAQAIKPFVAAILQVTLAAMPDGRQTDLGRDRDSPTITFPHDATRVLHIVFVRDAKLVLYDRRSGRVLTRLPMLKRSPDDHEEFADDSTLNDTVPASPRWTIFPPPGAPREVRGRRHEVRFWVAADGHVTSVEVTPPIMDDRYRGEFVKRMMAVLFSPATTGDGRSVDFVAAVTVIP